MSAPSLERTDKQPLGSTWYELVHYSYEIRERIVTKSTSQMVWYQVEDWTGKRTGAIRQARKAGTWFPTKREALEALRKRLEQQRDNAQNTYSAAVERLKKFNAKYAGELG